MKKGSFKGLVFREFYVARKNYGYNLLAYIILCTLALLALLSFKCGNLHRYAHLIEPDAKKMLESFIKFIPAYVACCFFGATADATPNDEKTPWRRFRIACPVTPFRQALAKYACLFLTFLLSFGLTFGWFGFHSLLTGTALTLEDLAATMALYTFAVVAIIYLQNVGIWARTLEKTLVVFMITVYGAMFLVFFKFPQVMYMLDFSNPEGNDKLMEIGTKFLPFTPLVIIGAFLVGILCTTMLYKRREK